MIYPPVKLVTGRKQVMKESVNRFKRMKRFITHIEALLREQYLPGNRPAEPLAGSRVIQNTALGILEIRNAPSWTIGIRGGGDCGVNCRLDPSSGDVRNLYITFRKSLCRNEYYAITYARVQGKDFYMASTADTLHSRYMYDPASDELTVIEDDIAGTDRILKKFPPLRESKVLSLTDKSESELIRELAMYRVQRNTLADTTAASKQQRSIRRALERKIAFLNGIVPVEEQPGEAVA